VDYNTIARASFFLIYFLPAGATSNTALEAKLKQEGTRIERLITGDRGIGIMPSVASHFFFCCTATAVA
jgi:hypothetical protein